MCGEDPYGIIKGPIMRGRPGSVGKLTIPIQVVFYMLSIGSWVGEKLAVLVRTQG